MCEKLMADDAEAVVNAVISAARGGDVAAARLILDRIVPPRRDSPIQFALPPIESAGDAVTAMASILRAVAAGDITPNEAGDVARLVETFARAHELHEIEGRVSALEAERGTR